MGKMIWIWFAMHTKNGFRPVYRNSGWAGQGEDLEDVVEDVGHQLETVIQSAEEELQSGVAFGKPFI